MEKYRWKSQYSVLPSLPCPRCKGTVRLDKDSLSHREPQYSQSARYNEHWHYYDVDKRFTCFLVCDQRFCGEVVAVSGIVGHDVEIVNGEDGPETEYPEFYYPKSMVPAPIPFAVSRKLSDECKVDLHNAFKLIWVDSDACANRLRVFVEHLLDQLGIPRRVPKTRSTLDDRIKLFGAQNPDHLEIMQALREVGNAGSHGGKSAFDDIIECFVLAEWLIKNLVEREIDEITAIARKLSEKHGRRTVDSKEQK
ncbi:DUF4145 domain-containing protein [Rhizobium leguminosarum]|uniref:DUF4145 domain-containing protein n=1 Tax=Rhizobium leguminosarum TaxID=384 RepID=A0AAJ1EFU1_RHILE|nr:DUF4145 domain-containing protein [Rhizobium leguminosarum]MBY5535924.1 DUF4145 domain-containing protein [Rhizobium leguminosarum]MBY5597280.1 DUF4145 domain-containing protein [Rhizobium leguminosarum]MBY5617277.1 DUF4145 domain-containing protein [Rhizobium leguminosarum]MBY5630322.1 DUF4145 domain-containing protein [Rhizobium leguminosarum]MBY5732667.1 DUF4145 domain-containing protein [Rhizobium leguminosarum]